jgi:hypothetical protein
MNSKRFIVVCFVLAAAVAFLLTSQSATGMVAPGARAGAAAAQDEKPQEAAPAAKEGAPAQEMPKSNAPFDSGQKQAEADRKSAGCITCHTYDKEAEPASMHPFGPDNIGCSDCHGGNFEVTRPEGTNRGDKAFEDAKKQAHVHPKNKELWKVDGEYSAGNPKRLYTRWQQESLEFIQFVNPGDLRVASRTCGVAGCHETEVANVDTSMMKHGALLWEAALYNNGGFNLKNARFGESYTKQGDPERLYPTKEKTVSSEEAWDKLMLHGIVPYLDPLPRWEISQPGNVLRVFEHGEDRQSLRGFGTGTRTDPVFLGLQKTRLLDPTLTFPGTNDQPGDYRQSGCTACHVTYANDRQESHGAPIPRSDLRSSVSNRGVTQSTDPMINNPEKADESGHPIRHVLTNNIPSSTCMVCHMHPGTNMVATYYGMIWWDNETDGKMLYPEKSFKRNPEEIQRISNRNPEESALRGKWGDVDFLNDVGKPDGEINKNLQKTQFGDFHGHGWIYRAVFKVDRKGNYLDHKGNIVPRVDGEILGQAMHPEKDATTGLPMLKDGMPVHMQDIHLEMGMQCVDCHFSGDGHGNGNLYSEVRAAIEIDCVDCHGTAQDYATLKTSGPAAEGEGKDRGRDLTKMRTKFLVNGRAREVRIFQKMTRAVEVGKPILGTAATATFPIKKGDFIQASYTDPNKVWRVVQTKDTATKSADHPEDYSEASAWAKTVQVDNSTWGDANAGDDKIAHPDSKMTCFACHTSWTTACFGCHLPMRATKRQPNLHNEGTDSRNWTNYNFQTLRDDVYMLGRDGTVSGNRIAPIRSSCALLVSSQSINREWFYTQQQTISAEGYAGTAFSSYMPHTVRGEGETKMCSDCHVSKENDNNAILAQLTLQGANAANFVGRLAYVAEEGGGFEAIAVTERAEPQAVFGSDLHKMAFPEDYDKFVKGGRKLGESYSHRAGIGNETLTVQMRGEYLYAANGDGGLRIYDISRIDDKLFAQRISTSIVSPVGQRTNVDTKYASAVASPSTLAVDPTATIFQLTGVPLSEHYRRHLPENGEAFYRVSAKDANAMRLARVAGEPLPKVGYDPQPIAPHYGFLYVADREEGLVMTLVATLLDGDPENNFLERSEFEGGGDHWNPDGVLEGASNITVAGNYAYISTPRGVAVVDVHDIKVDDENKTVFHPNPRLVKVLPIPNAHDVQVQFRYAFVTSETGLHVVDLTNPEDPQVVDAAFVAIPDARNLYLSRSYAFVAAKSRGLAILDVTVPTAPKAPDFLPGMYWNADGQMDDVRDVKIAMTNNSMFAYVADGDNGLRIVQLTSSDDTPGIYGYAPSLTPKLIATKKTRGPAVAISEGLDRDRAVDESGNQLSVFGRRGARPFNAQEMRKLYISSLTGQFYTVSDTPTGPPTATTTPVRDKATETSSIARPSYDLVPLLLPMGLLFLSRRRRSAGRRR